MNKKGYEFYCADNSFNENEFLYESKILIIKFDILISLEILNSFIDSSIFKSYNKGKALFKNEKQLFLYFKSDNYFCELYSQNSSLVFKVNDSKIVINDRDINADRTNNSGIGSYFLKDGSSSPLYVLAGIFSNSIELSLYSASHEVLKKTGFNPGIKSIIKKEFGNFFIDSVTKKMIERNTITEKVVYSNVTELINNVQNIVSSLNSMLFGYLGYESFWNNNNNIKTPKKEVDSHHAISLMLVDKVRKAGLELHSEESSPAGNVDFYLTGYVENIGSCGVCIEVKNAHSTRLRSGFLEQLPEYVKRKNAVYGIYLILYFNSDNYEIYESFEDFHHPADLLNTLRINPIYASSHRDIVAYSLDVSRPKQASRM